jgi:hypothetical protein
LWVDVAKLIADADRLRGELERLDKDRMETLDPGFIPRIATVSAPTA